MRIIIDSTNHYQNKKRPAKTGLVLIIVDIINSQIEHKLLQYLKLVE